MASAVKIEKRACLDLHLLAQNLLANLRHLYGVLTGSLGDTLLNSQETI